MIDWLNKFIGTDWATYIGAFLAIVTLFVGSSKIWKKSQKQNIKNGNGIQAGGNVIINIKPDKDN
ncbi:MULTISPECIES: hypothetical protein [Methylobacter]